MEHVDLTQSSSASCGDTPPKVIIIKDDTSDENNRTPERPMPPYKKEKKMKKRQYGFRFYLPKFSENEDTDSEPGIYLIIEHYLQIVQIHSTVIICLKINT